MITRKVTTYYEAADGTEPDITVEVEQQDRFTARVCDDLDAVPEGERQGVWERAVHLFWQAERAAYLQGSPDAE